jgi:tetratricopeptide (TPR) repeat protein
MMTEKALGDPTPLAEEGKKLYQAGKFQQAAGAFSQAADFYDQAGNGVLAAEMRNNQAVSLLKTKDPGGALEAVRGTAEIFLSSGMEMNAAMALGNEGTSLQDLGKQDQAQVLFTRAAEIFKRLGMDEMYLQTMQSISGIKFKQRNVLGALISMQEGLEELDKPNLRQKMLRNLLKLPQNLVEK